MNITIIGSGYVGLVSGVCLAHVGHNVVCCDVDSQKIESLQLGICPIYEPGLEELLLRVIESGNISFTTQINDAIAKSSVIMSAVGTPMGKSYEADLQYVRQVAEEFSKCEDSSFKVFVNKSTVPVGTAQMVQEIISEQKSSQEFAVVSNPEFLREGCAVKDFLEPSRIVIGCEDIRAQELLEELYEPFTAKGYVLMSTDIKSAELIKYASNSMLATRISFMNELSRFCEVVGADITQVAIGMGMDPRIGLAFLSAGCGYGGSCFPKDVNALIQSGREVGVDLNILQAVNDVNDEQKLVVVDKILKSFEAQDLRGRVIGIWGLSFKENTDDLREATSLSVISKCSELGARIKVYDPIVSREQFEGVCKEEVEWCSSQFRACEGVDVLCVLNCSQEFLSVDWKRCNMKRKLVIDGRNCYDRKELEQCGIDLRGIGK
ncbi:MAG: UDP-glucose dehydrogenase family protein [Candidatus Nanoarchaeia archaeon]